jgi:hypothetical protein
VLLKAPPKGKNAEGEEEEEEDYDAKIVSAPHLTIALYQLFSHQMQRLTEM